jgi:hypothetical protein
VAALIITKTPMLTTYASPLQFKPELVALAPPKVGGSANSEGRFSSLAEMRALLTKCYKIKPISYREYASSVKSPARFNPAGFYVQFQSGPHQGEMVDFTTIKNINDYLSSTDKVAFMDYGFRDMGLQQINMRDAQGRNVTTVTLAEFRKINGAYEDALKDSGGSNTPAMRQALKDLNALGERLYPATKIQTKPRQKTRAVSVPFGPNHNSRDSGQPWDNSLGNASGAKNNILPSELKKRKPEHPATCKLTVSSEYTMTTQQGQFDQNGKAIIEPVAENHLKLRGKIETNRIGAKLSFKLEIGNTDVGVVSSPTVRNMGNLNYVSYKLDGVKSIPSFTLTPTILKQNKVSFDNFVYQNLNLYPEVVSAECVIDGKRVGADIIQDSKIFQNGKRVQ